jgi:hypothetical protein
VPTDKETLEMTQTHPAHDTGHNTGHAPTDEAAASAFSAAEITAAREAIADVLEGMAAPTRQGDALQLFIDPWGFGPFGGFGGFGGFGHGSRHHGPPPYMMGCEGLTSRPLFTDRDIARILTAAQEGLTRDEKAKQEIAASVAETRVALAALVADAGCDIYLAVDRSGSVSHDRLVAEQQEEFCRTLAAAAHDTGAQLEVFAFSDQERKGGRVAAIFPLKTFDGELDYDKLQRVGGGGTPTEGALAYARLQALESKAAHRLIFVITDGQSFKIKETGEQVAAAFRDGCKVYGIGQHVSARDMDEQFGQDGWLDLDQVASVGAAIKDAVQLSGTRPPLTSADQAASLFEVVSD